MEPTQTDGVETADNGSLPSTIYEWRERILAGVLRGTFIFWAIALLAGIYSTVQSDRWQDNPTVAIVLVVIYAITAVVLGYITFRSRMNFGVRSGLILFTLYALGAIGLFGGDLNGDGRIFLFTFVVMTAIFWGLRRSLVALGVSVLTMAAAAVLLALGVLPATRPTNFDIGAWLSAGIVFILLGLAMVFSIASLIRDLDQSLVASRQERNFVSAILNTSGALIVLFDLDGRIVRFNKACEQLTGYSANDVKGKRVWDLFLTSGGVELTRAVFDQVIAGHSPSTYESYWLTKSGERRLIAWSTTSLNDQKGVVEFVVSTGIDVTVHQQAEAERERLLAAEHEQRLLAETLTEVTLALTAQISPAAVLDEILRRVQRVVPLKTVNIALLEDEETLRIVRWQGYETFGGDEVMADLIQPVSTLPLEAEAIRSRRAVIIEDTRQEPRWASLNEMGWIRSHLIVPLVLQDRVLGLLRLDGNMPGEFSARDVKRLQPLANAAAIALENARLHQETFRQAQRVQQILDTAQEGILLLDGNYRVEMANPAAQTYLRALADAGLGDTLSRVAGHSIGKLLEPLPEGMPWHELTIPRQGRIFEAAAQPIQDGVQGGGWVMVLREVTEARKQQQYVQAQERLAMVGQLAAGIAHDFNNIMTVIILYAQMLLKSPEFASGDDQRMNIIFRQAKMAANLIAQILDFSRQSVMEKRPLNLVYFLKELLKMLKRTLPENIRLDLIYDEAEEYGVSADLTRLQQAVMNLAVNARDAMPEGGKLVMKLERVTVAAGEKRPLPEIEPGEWLTLAVSDTGAGIKTEDLPHVFEPFYTTKQPGKGTGLGLAQVYGIIVQHGGHIDLTSKLGEGTTFTIYLPAMKLDEVVVSDTEEMVVTAGGGETIMVVEDDDYTREAVCDVLRTLNYHALAAPDGDRALEIFSQYNGDVSLVISDMVMPVMSGAKLYTRLQEINPEIKMVIITGYPFGEQDKAMLSQGIVAWVQKPFVSEQIATAVQEALAE